MTCSQGREPNVRIRRSPKEVFPQPVGPMMRNPSLPPPPVSERRGTDFKSPAAAAISAFMKCGLEGLRGMNDVRDREMTLRMKYSSPANG